MSRQRAKDFDQELLILFDAYVHGTIDRRGFLQAAQKFAVGGATAAGLLAALSPDFALGQVIAKDDARIRSEWVEFASPKGSGTVRAYVTRPAGASGKLPAVLVAHENRGLNPHIEDIARRLALDNFMAIAPDALTPLGGYPGDEEKARELFPKLDQVKVREDFVACANYIRTRADSTGKIGAVGFCYGGGVVSMLAHRLGADLAAGVPFYGGQPTAEDTAKIKAAMLINYAGVDERINAGWLAWEAALKANNVRYEGYIYAGTQHGFNNDTTPRYDAAAAKLAWERTIAHFNKYVRG